MLKIHSYIFILFFGLNTIASNKSCVFIFGNLNSKNVIPQPVKEILDEFGPPRSLGEYVFNLQQLQLYHSKLINIKKLERDRSVFISIENLPFKEFWGNRFIMDRKTQVLSENDINNLSNNFKRLIEHIDFLSQIDTQILKKIKKELIYFASIFPEVNTALNEVIYYSFTIPKKSRLGNSWGEIIFDLAEKGASQEGNVLDFRIKKFLNELGSAERVNNLLNVRGGTVSYIGIYSIHALLNIYFYSLAKVANLNRPELVPTGKSRWIKFWKETDWMPIPPAKALEDLITADIFYEYQVLKDFLSEDKFYLFSRGLARSPKIALQFKKDMGEILRNNFNINQMSIVQKDKIRITIEEYSKKVESDLSYNIIKEIVERIQQRTLMIPF